MPLKTEIPTKKNNMLFIVGLIAATLIIIYALISFELVRRSKRDYTEGEKYFDFYKNPDKKKVYYDEKLAKKQITEAEYAMLLEDSALKNALVWYETVVDLYAPPENKWITLSRERLKEVRPLYTAWAETLKSQALPPVKKK